ncbi:unnamed protein product, partial [marine sediment metagenome]
GLSMKTIIAGSRGFTLSKFPDAVDMVQQAIDESKFPITEIVSGQQRTYEHGKIVGGADYIGELWAEMVDVPVKLFPADWDGFGKAAGFMRNRDMAHYSESLIAIWDMKSPGTRHMAKQMQKLDKKVYIFPFNE